MKFAKIFKNIYIEKQLWTIAAKDFCNIFKFLSLSHFL